MYTIFWQPLGQGQGFFRIIKNQGGGDPSPKPPSPSPQTKVTIVGKNEIYNRENLVRPFLVHQVLGPKPPPPLPPLLKRSPGQAPFREGVTTDRSRVYPPQKSRARCARGTRTAPLSPPALLFAKPCTAWPCWGPASLCPALPGGGGYITTAYNGWRIPPSCHPPPKTKVTIVGKNEIYHWKHLVGPFLVPPPDFFFCSNACLGGGGGGSGTQNVCTPRVQPPPPPLPSHRNKLFMFCVFLRVMFRV